MVIKNLLEQIKKFLKKIKGFFGFVERVSVKELYTELKRYNKNVLVKELIIQASKNNKNDVGVPMDYKRVMKKCSKKQIIKAIILLKLENDKKIKRYMKSINNSFVEEGV